MMIRRIRYFIFNGFFTACLYFGFIEGNDGARNVALFIVWLLFVFSFICLTKTMQEEMHEKGRAIPSIIDNSFDLGVTLFLAWHGVWITAIAYFLHLMFSEAGWQQTQKMAEKKEAEA